MANAPLNEESQTNGRGCLIPGCLKLVLVSLGLCVILYVVLAFLGLVPFPGKARLGPEVTLELADIVLVGIQPDQDIEIVRTGLRLPYVTENCSSPVSTNETITHERMYTLGVELDISESNTSEIIRELTGGGSDITQVEVSIAEGIAREMSRSLGIRMNESIRIESSREIETPAGYRSSVSLQWEEAHTIGYATIQTGSGSEIKEILLPFSYVSHMHLAQVETVYTSCADGTTVISSAGGIPVIQSAITAQNPVQITSPANTECKNPVSFAWISEPSRKYMVTARPLSANSQAGIESTWIEGGVWEKGLPADLWGSWEWFVTRDDNVRSAPVVFVFNPFPAVNKDQGCSEARAGALDGSDITAGSVPSATATPAVNGAETMSEPVEQQEASVDEPQNMPSSDIGATQSLPTATVLSPQTDASSYPYPEPSDSTLVPTPEIMPTSPPGAGYPYPPPTPFIYP